MSAKHLRLIALGLVVLLFLWGGSELLSRGSDSVTGSLALPALSVKDVDTISVVKGTDSIVIVKQSPTAWSVNGHRAALPSRYRVGPGSRAAPPPAVADCRG